MIYTIYELLQRSKLNDSVILFLKKRYIQGTIQFTSFCVFFGQRLGYPPFFFVFHMRYHQNFTTCHGAEHHIFLLSCLACHTTTTLLGPRTRTTTSRQTTRQQTRSCRTRQGRGQIQMSRTVMDFRLSQSG